MDYGKGAWERRRGPRGVEEGKGVCETGKRAWERGKGSMDWVG